jgi:hypothetical protein
MIGSSGQGMLLGTCFIENNNDWRYSFTLNANWAR